MGLGISLGTISAQLGFQNHWWGLDSSGTQTLFSWVKLLCYLWPPSPPSGYLSHCVISWSCCGWMYIAGTLNWNCMSLTDTWENPSCIATGPEGPWQNMDIWWAGDENCHLITVFMSTRVLMKAFNNNEWTVTTTITSTSSNCLHHQITDTAALCCVLIFGCEFGVWEAVCLTSLVSMFSQDLDFTEQQAFGRY